MKLKITREILFILTFVGLILLIAFIKDLTHKKQKPHEVPPRPVQIAQVIQKDAPTYVDSFGFLTSPHDVNIVSQVTGKILDVHFEEGDEVASGDLLFTIDPREYQADLDKAKASLLQDTANLKLQKDILERNKKLIAKELISEQEYENYETNVKSAEAQVALDRANIESAKINLDYCQIHSPAKGITGKRLVDPGNIVTANNGPTLVNIQMITPLYIDFPVPERYLPEIKDNMAKNILTVEISVTDTAKDLHKGFLSFINNTVDDETGTIALRATIPNQDKKLWPGQYVTVRLYIDTIKDALLVPVAAVRLGQKGIFIFVINQDNEAEYRDNIKQGLQEKDLIVISGDIKQGEQVVTQGQMGLRQGTKVKIVTGDQNS